MNDPHPEVTNVFPLRNLYQGLYFKAGKHDEVESFLIKLLPVYQSSAR